MRRLFTTLFIITILAIGLSFTSLNALDVEINYYFSTVTIPLAVVVLIALAIGVFLGLLVSMTYVVIHRSENSRLRKKVNLYEKEIKNLRELPIKDQR